MSQPLTSHDRHPTSTRSVDYRSVKQALERSSNIRHRLRRANNGTLPSRFSKKSPLYVRLADDLTQQVARGALRTGDRVPSLRELSRRKGISISTALQAYLLLERGYLEARPQSGFYVRIPSSESIPNRPSKLPNCRNR